MEIEVTPTGIEIRLDGRLYNEAVVFKCFYWYGAQYEVIIDAAKDGCSFSVTIAPRSGSFSGPDVQALCSRVRRDVVDFKTRDIVARETRGVRELLVAKAFASFDDLDDSLTGGAAELAGTPPEGRAHAHT